MTNTKEVPKPQEIGYNAVSFAIERGKSARRRSWEPAVKIYGQSPVIYCEGKPWHPSQEDELAKDWVIE